MSTRNPLVALILGAVASMAVAREAFNKKVGGSYVGATITWPRRIARG